MTTVTKLCPKCGSVLEEQLYGTEMSIIYVCPNCD